jgi:hypothetical protein
MVIAGRFENECLIGFEWVFWDGYEVWRRNFAVKGNFVAEKLNAKNCKLKFWYQKIWSQKMYMEILLSKNVKAENCIIKVWKQKISIKSF